MVVKMDRFREKAVLVLQDLVLLAEKQRSPTCRYRLYRLAMNRGMSHSEYMLLLRMLRRMGLEYHGKSHHPTVTIRRADIPRLKRLLGDLGDGEGAGEIALTILASHPRSARILLRWLREHPRTWNQGVSLRHVKDALQLSRNEYMNLRHLLLDLARHGLVEMGSTKGPGRTQWFRPTGKLLKAVETCEKDNIHV